MAMIRCAFLEVHVEEEMFAEFGDEDDIENVEDESVGQEGPVGEGLGEAEVEHKVEVEAMVTETHVDRNATSVGNNDAQPLTWDVVNLGESEPRESIPLRELDACFP